MLESTSSEFALRIQAGPKRCPDIVAGNGRGGYVGDGGPATNAGLMPGGIVVDGAGNLFIADLFNNRVRKVPTSGIITTVAGNGTLGFSGTVDPPLMQNCRLSLVWQSMARATFSIADLFNNRVRKVSTSGIITTVAGNGDFGFSGDGGLATDAQLDLPPRGVAVDGAGNLFIADDGNNRVRKVSTSGIITTVAGNGTPGFSGDSGPATNAELSSPSGVAVDGAGNLFIADDGNNRVRKVSTSGIITTVAGNGTPGFSGTVGPPRMHNCLIIRFMWQSMARATFSSPTIFGCGTY